MREWQQKESGLGPGAETQYINEWQPAHGYRGCGSWEVTRIAVENACVNEGLELSRGELDEGTNIWFYSGVTLQFFNSQYGSGWNAFISWFERVSGEKVPNFGEEEMMAQKNIQKNIKKIMHDTSRDTPLVIVGITDKENRGTVIVTREMGGKKGQREGIW